MQADAVILNPHANGGAGLTRWRSARDSAKGRELGLDRAAVFEDKGGDLSEALKSWLGERINAGDRRFVIAGGDGTVNLSLGAYLKLRGKGNIPDDIVFGAIGTGSSNDFHKPFDRGSRSRIAGYACRLGFSDAYEHDACDVAPAGKAGSRFFFINASMGVTAEANERFNDGRVFKRVSVDGAILVAALSTFSTYRNRRVRVKIDHYPAQELALTNLSIIKNRHFSGSFRYDEDEYAPTPSDGLLGVRICREMSRLEMVRTLAALSKGRFTGRPKTECISAKEVFVESIDGCELAIETDGEVVMAKACRFTVRPKGVLLCP